MGFLHAYKRLDNLCRDMNGKGVTGYIEDMQSCSRGSYYVPGWMQDYGQLKHYRYLRNQIVHENNIDEDNMCTDSDVQWIEEFHQRILTQKDPLACYYRAVRPHPVKKDRGTQRTTLQTPAPPVESHQDEAGSSPQLRRMALILCALAVVLFVMGILSRLLS